MYREFSKMSMALVAMGLLSGFFISSCGDKATSVEKARDQDTIIVPAPSEFRGTYQGEYIRIKNFSSVGYTGYQHVEWTFTDTKFWCAAVDINTITPFVCNFTGFYVITDKMNFRNVAISDSQCDRDDVTEGAFNMYFKKNQSGGDSLIFIQYDSGKDTYKMVKLVKTQ